MGHDLAVRFKHICPECQLFFGRVFRSEISAPPVRESLQSGTLGRCQTADGIGHRCRLRFRVVDDQTVIESILPIEAAGMRPSCHRSHNTLVQMRCRCDGGRVFVIPRHQGRCDFFCHLHIGAGGHGIHILRCADCVSVCRIQGKAYILIDAISLRTILVLAADHVALQDEGLLLHPRLCCKCR